MNLHNRVLCLTFLAIFASCGSEETPESDSDNVTVDTLHYLVPFDSIGVELGDSTMMFGSIWGTTYTPEGNIAILDGTFRGIRFFTADGEHLFDFTPQGEGPGEFLKLNRMAFDEEGNLYLAGTNDRKVALYDSDLNFVREVLFTGSSRSYPTRFACAPESAFVIMTGIFNGSDSAGFEIALFSDNSIPDVIYRRRIAHTSGGMSFSNLTGMTFAVGANGNVYIANTDRETHLITCYSPEGDSLFTFGHENYQPSVRSDSLIEALRTSALEQYVNYYGTVDGFNYDLPAEFHSIVSIGVDHMNRIWVRGEEHSTRADVFNESGEFLYTLQAILPAWQDPGGWNMRICNEGVLIDPRDPEMYPVVYQMQEEIEIVSL